MNNATLELIRMADELDRLGLHHIASEIDGLLGEKLKASGMFDWPLSNFKNSCDEITRLSGKYTGPNHSSFVRELNDSLDLEISPSFSNEEIQDLYLDDADMFDAYLEKMHEIYMSAYMVIGSSALDEELPKPRFALVENMASYYFKKWNISE